MFIDKLLNQDNMPLLEQALRFSAARQQLIAENVSNVDTPGYVQKDLSPEKFQEMLQQRVDERRSAPPGTLGFDDITGELNNPTANILFHDRNNRSMEQLMSDTAKNLLYHNMMIELLRKQIGTMNMAINEKAS